MNFSEWVKNINIRRVHNEITINDLRLEVEYKNNGNYLYYVYNNRTQRFCGGTLSAFALISLCYALDIALMID